MENNIIKYFKLFTTILKQYKSSITATRTDKQS